MQISTSSPRLRSLPLQKNVRRNMTAYLHPDIKEIENRVNFQMVFPIYLPLAIVHKSVVHLYNYTPFLFTHEYAIHDGMKVIGYTVCGNFKDCKGLYL